MKDHRVDSSRAVSGLKIAIAFCLLVCLLVVAASGQSGRKPTKPSKPTPPSSDADSTSSSSSSTATSGSDKPASTTTTIPARDSRPRVTVLVADNGFGDVHDYGRIMMDRFIHTLEESQNFSTTPIGAMKKNQAAARSKEEQSGWVVYANITVDRLRDMNGYPYSIPDMTFYYSVYAAGSDQEKAKGKVRYENYKSSGRGPIGLPSPIPTTGSSTMTPEETGRAAAHEVMIAMQGANRPSK